ncbi:DEAD2 domain protein [Teladorsagia circumcincta]|uniref:DEAD2 domain protein n=1 Tax=Teladorsagia circumcincta TaxID=45464 RepID=A0A2G9UFX3_TELCI|nr:DEAD2 domain protein [Teladorsagia circumcincta]
MVSRRTCHYYNNWDRTPRETLDNLFTESGNIPDIEDMVAIGEKHKICPFYRCRQMQETAELVLSPYNYIIDPQLRKTHKVDLSGSIVIFDEAHNLDNSSQAFGSMTEESEKQKGPYFQVGDAAVLLSMLFELEVKVEATFNNPSALSLEGFPGKATAGAIKTDKITIDPKRIGQHFKLYIVKEEETADKPACTVMKFWCFSPSIAMQALKINGVRTVVVTSGTLSPLTNFTRAIGL